MYETETYEVILRRMLERVAAKFDRREGSIIYDGVAPAAVEFQNIYIALEAVLREMFPDTATREYLIKHCAERGISPKPSSYAKVMGSFTPTNLDVPIGARFSHEDLNYKVTEKISDGKYELECETSGSVANGVTGRLIPIDYVEKLETAYIDYVVVPGEDDEATETLRARYFASINSESFGGNEFDYKNKILSLDGVGGVKVYGGSQWNGGGTVKCVIIDSEYGVPDEGLIDDVQAIIDPELEAILIEGGDEQHPIDYGEGKGFAPIGHFVTIVGAYNTVINIETSLTYNNGYTWDRVKDDVKTSINKYFRSLNEKWSNMDKIRVRIAHIENAILNVDGILDVQGTKINGKEENLAVDKDSVVTGGTINGYQL